MKIYVISDKTNDAIAAANYINGSGHVAMVSESSGESDQKALLNDLRANVGDDFDMVLMIVGNAKSMAISANKVSGAMAVACKDSEDSTEAATDTRANVIIIDSKVTKSEMTSIIGGMFAKKGKNAARAREEEPEPEREKERETARAPRSVESGEGFFSSLKNAASSTTRGIKKSAAKVKSAASMKGDSGMLSSVKSKGLLKSLKDSLGIVDDGK